MLLKKNSKKIFNEEVVYRAGMNGKGVFQIVGTAPEPQYVWDKDNRKYTDEVSGYGIWVRQSDGEYQQNPIMIVIPNISENKANDFKFGDFVKLKNFGGYYSRKKHVYRWQADSIYKDKEETNNVKSI